MISLITGRDQRMQSPGQEDWYADEGDWDSCYSHTLQSIIVACLRADPNRRISLKKLLINTKVGLARWESVYGTANRNADTIPFFMRYDLQSKDEFPIGAKAPGHYGWPKKRKSEEDPIDPALHNLVPGPRSSKKARTLGNTQSEAPADRHLAALAGSAVAGPSPADISKTLLGTSPQTGELTKAHEELGKDVIKSESSEDRGGMVLKSLREKRADRVAKEAEEKNKRTAEDKDISRELRAELVKQEVVAKKLEFQAVDGDDDVQVAV